MEVPEIPVDNESSDLVRKMMADARARAGFVPGASASKAESQPPLPLTTEQQDFDDSAEAANLKSSTLIATLQAQLAAPKVAPTGLSEEEEQEVRRNRAWDLQHKLKNKEIDEASKRNVALLENMTATVADPTKKRGRIPNCDDLLTWESNATSAETQPRTKARSTTERAAVNPIDILEGQNLTWRNVWKFEMSYGW